MLTAAEATALRNLDLASAKLTVPTGSVTVTDNASALLNPSNAAALATVGTININGFVSVNTLNDIRAVGGTANSEVYTYRLEDSVPALLSTALTTVDNATAVNVKGVVSVQDMAFIEQRAGSTNAVPTVTSYEVVSGTAIQLFGGAGSTLNATVAAKALTIDLVGAATIAQVDALKADKQFDGSYNVADTAAALVDAINQAGSLAVLQGAGTVGLASGQFATAEQAKMINANLSNELPLAIRDTAAVLGDVLYSQTVASAGTVTVDASDSALDGLAAGLTTAQVIYDFDSLAEIGRTTGSQIEVINGKAGDRIDLSGIVDWGTVTAGNQTLTLGANAASLFEGQYFIEIGFFDEDGVFTASELGTDSRILIGTDATSGADEIIVVRGVTDIKVDSVIDANVFTFG